VRESDPESVERLASRIRDVPDFPKPGILFKDITPLLGDPAALQAAIEALTGPHRGMGITHVAAVESRGFILGAPAALALEAGFVPIRKPGKLPSATAAIDYALEYGADRLEVHADALGVGTSRVLVLDDVLATGGTAAAACSLVEAIGGTVVACAFLVEIADLGGRARLGGWPVTAVLRY